jgi:ABC-type lipoprotein export system ATPase subunit
VAGLDLRNLSYAEERALRARVGFVFQSGGLLANATIGDNIGLGLAYHSVPAMGRDELHRRVRTIAEELGIEEFLLERSATSSGSVHKRALVARALLSEPQILLADEPFVPLATAEAALVAEAVRRRMHARRMTVVLATHGALTADLRMGRTLYLDAGQITKSPPREGDRLSRA